MVRSLVVCSLVLAAAACIGSTADPQDTLVELPVPATPDTLLPVVTDPSPTTTVAPPLDALFDGDLCGALTAADLRAAAPLVPTDRTDPEIVDPDEVPPDSTVAPGELPDFLALLLADDSCRFELRRPIRFSAVISARSATEYAAVTSAGKGVDRGIAFEVYVEVPNGWFSVLAPDEVTARRLASAATRRA